MSENNIGNGCATVDFTSVVDKLSSIFVKSFHTFHFGAMRGNDGDAVTTWRSLRAYFGFGRCGCQNADSQALSDYLSHAPFTVIEARGSERNFTRRYED